MSRTLRRDDPCPSLKSSPGAPRPTCRGYTWVFVCWCATYPCGITECHATDARACRPRHRIPRGLSEGAPEALGGFPQLVFEGVDLLGNVGELFFCEHAGPGDLMGLAIGATPGGADFHRNLRELAFLGHCGLRLQR